MTAQPLHPSFPGDLDEQGVTRVGLPVAVGEVRDEEAMRLLLGFESLGEDCEFGLLQRRYGAETLSLMRWMTALATVLPGLLGARFEGVGDPAQTRIDVAPWGELMASDTRYGLRMHSFVHRSGVDVARFAVNQARRMAFLRRKLLEDLAEHRKVFVVQAGETMTDGLASAIGAALRCYGPNVLLAVGLATGEHPCGTVLAREDGVLRGFIDRRGKTSAPGGGHRWDINFEAWLALCRQAAQLVAGGFGR